MKSTEHRIGSLLQEIECHLQQLGLWTDTPPSQQALSSQAPFCMDSMPFNQWLQWVFLPRIHAHNRASDSLPFRCAVSSLAELWLQEQGHANKSQALINSLKALDRLLSPVEH